MQKIYLVACAAVSCLALVIAASHVDITNITTTLASFSLATLAGVATALLIGALIAGVRLRVMAADMGARLSLRDAIAAMAAGQIAGAVTIQFFGQIAARGMVLSSRGFSLPTNIVVSAYERIIALVVGATLALFGAWLLFGQLAVDMQSGGTELARIAVGVVVAGVGGAALGWGWQAKLNASRQLSWAGAVAVLRSTGLTLAIHASTAAAYVLAARALAPDVPLLSLLSASLVVMFAASLPISFAGWGVREISAVVAFRTIGVSPEAALAVSILIGLSSLGAVVAIGAVTPFLSSSKPNQKTGSAPQFDITKAVAWTIPLAAATLVTFQIYVPVRNGVLNVNPADVVAVLGGVLFIAQHVGQGWPVWRLVGFNAHIAAMAGVILLALLIGIVRFGATDWALVNKGIGFLILLGYTATGALIVVNADGAGRRTLLLTFLGALLAILLMSFTLIMLGSSPVQAMSGLSQNRNAFMFTLLLALCLLPFLSDRRQAAVLGLVLLGIIIGGSRAGLGCAAAIVVVALCLRVVSVRTVLLAFAIALGGFAIIATIAISPATPVTDPFILMAQQADPERSNSERLRSITEGLELFIDHPFFGAGLGAFMAAQTRAGTPLVIHSTPLWIAAEMGIVGLLAFASPAIRVFVRAWRERGEIGNALILLIVAFAIFSTVHDVMYQRTLWLIAGTLLAVSSAERSGKQENAPDNSPG